MSAAELLTMLQEACFRYYWEGAHPVAGTTLENIPRDDRIVATGASGFGIMVLIVGVDRGFITRDQSLERLIKIVTFLEKVPGEQNGRGAGAGGRREWKSGSEYRGSRRCKKCAPMHVGHCVLLRLVFVSCGAVSAGVSNK
jgi:hypothetical protein